jgi:hypothetical protein
MAVVRTNLLNWASAYDDNSIGAEGIECLNLLNTKRNLLYIRNQSAPRCKHFKTQSALCKESVRTAL